MHRLQGVIIVTKLDAIFVQIRKHFLVPKLEKCILFDKHFRALPEMSFIWFIAKNVIFSTLDQPLLNLKFALGITNCQ